jgi:hypothetical protein
MNFPSLTDSEKEAVEAAAAAAALVQSKRLKGRSYREAAEKAQAQKPKPKVDRKTKSQPSSPARSSPSGLVMEVVITVPSGHRSLNLNGRAPSTSSVADSPPESGSDSDAPRKSQRRAAKRKAVVISDDEDSEVEKPKKKRASTQKTSSSRKKNISKASASESSDYEASPEEDDSDAEEIVESSDEDISSKKANGKKSKSVAKPRASAKASSGKSGSASSNNETEDDEIRVDDPKPKKKATKRKAADDNDRPAKKQKRADSDPWKLESKDVRKDWTRMKAPPLEMFHFARKVVDEYTYLDGKIHSLVTRLTAERHWVLSGTPPIHDFFALKTISAFLNIHLGIDDDAEGKSAEIKKRRREQTGKIRILDVKFVIIADPILAVERFHSFREVHSLEWHAHRHQHGQEFLDRFVRQVSSSIQLIEANL